MTNVQGSSAGAGSGEFHVYKASRRREYERVKAMDDASLKEKEDAEWEAKREEARRKDAEKLGKNQKRRQKAKERSGKKKGAGSGAEESAPKMRKLEPMKQKIDDGEEVNGGEVPEAVEEEAGITILDED